MKIFTLCLSNEGEVKLTGDLELAQAKQLIESILLQQAFQQGIIKGKEEIKEVKDVKENESSAEESREGSLQECSQKTARRRK